MTVEELLDLATLNLSLVDGAIGHETVMQYIATAQAAATTAQAMMLAQMTTTGENVTTGETIRWLRVDTGN